MQEQHQNTIRNISKEIKRECFRSNIPVSESFIYFYVDLLYLNPDHEISANILSNRDAVVVFVKTVVEELRNKNTPYFQTLKMQWYFKDLMKCKEEVVSYEREEMERHTRSLKTLILNRKQLNSTFDIEAFKKKIVCYASLRVGLGNPMLEPVFKEGLYALRSIMHDDEIQEFAKLPYDKKEEQLEVITHLIAGIRLFNKDSNKGGEGIPELAETLTNSRFAIKHQLREIMSEVVFKIELLTAILDKCYVFDKTETGRTCMKLELPPDVTEAEIVYIRDLLMAFRQYQVFMNIIAEAQNSRMVKAWLNAYRLNTIALNNICFDRVAVSSTKVFPLFEKHAQVWIQLQNEGLYLIHASNIIKTLTQCLAICPYPEHVVDNLLSYIEVISDETRKRSTFDDFEIPAELGTQFCLLPVGKSLANEKRVFLHGKGYDLFKFAYTDGALIPGSFANGIWVTLGKVRSVFSEGRSISGFVEALDENLLRCIDVIRRRVPFINMFGLRYLLEALADEKIAVEKVGKKNKGKSIGIQAEYESEDESYIDPTYKWNIWDWKRDAIKLANYTHCQTHSTQTEDHVGSVACQTVEMEDVNSDTHKDNYSNVETPSRFIFGLRGRKNEQPFDIELTRPVDK